MHSLNITRCIKHGVTHKVHQVQRKQIDSHKVCSKCSLYWHEHKHASAFGIGQLRHQSATAPSRTIHAIDAVAAYRCHELWPQTHVAEWQTIAPDIWPTNSPDLSLEHCLVQDEEVSRDLLHDRQYSCWVRSSEAHHGSMRHWSSLQDRRISAAFVPTLTHQLMPSATCWKSSVSTLWCNLFFLTKSEKTNDHSGDLWAWLL